MKIAFVTSCLEPEKDGVGDYTYLLAQECVKRGYGCCLLSINDRFSPQVSYFDIEINGKKIPVLRLPAHLPWSQRIAHAQKLFASFQASWLSLQFVPYGFQDKGIVFNLCRWLPQISRGQKIHIMFHELWIGQTVGAKLNQRFIGSIQKFFILWLVKQLRPDVIHSSNAAYIQLLKQHGITAGRLSLFGNIPIIEQNANSWLFPTLQTAGLEITEGNREQFWLVGFFGTLQPIWPPEPLFTYLHQAAQQHHKKIAMISIGRLGSGKNLWEDLAKSYASKFTFLQLGNYPAEQVSAFLNSIDVGVATSPYLLVEKSGTVATMLEHGLPVIVNRDEVRLTLHSSPIETDEAQLYKMEANLPDKIGEYLYRKPAKSRLTTTVSKFLEDLHCSTLKVSH